MNVFVYAGAAQLASLAHWPSVLTLSNFLALLLIVLIINSRFILMGASIYPYFRPFPYRLSLPLLWVNTDLTWLLTMRHAQEAREEKTVPDLGFFIGISTVTWWMWTFSSIPGWLLGAAVTDLKKYGLDLFVTVFMASLMVPMWKGIRFARPWMVAGAVCLYRSSTLARLLLHYHRRAFWRRCRCGDEVMILSSNMMLILGMGLVTYFCRIAGFLIMHFVPFTPAVRRGLEALLALLWQLLWCQVLLLRYSGYVAVAAALVTMLTIKRDVAAMVIGCAAAALCRAAGF